MDKLKFDAKHKPQNYPALRCRLRNRHTRYLLWRIPMEDLGRVSRRRKRQLSYHKVGLTLVKGEGGEDCVGRTLDHAQI